MLRGAVTAAIVLLALSACGGAGGSDARNAPLAPPAHVFTLTDQNGRRVTVGQRNGEPTALYFGFAHCKDVCPQTLERLNAARKKAGLSPDQVRIVMVTVDPARDTPAKLKKFLGKTQVQAVALTGPAKQLRGVYREYGVIVQPAAHDIGHTDYVYLINRAGRLTGALSPQTAVADIAQRLRTL